MVEALRKSLRTGSTTVDILRGLDFTIERGEFVAIMGASGSGKSTLLGLLAGLDNPSSGNVRWQGTAISYLPENELAQLRGRTIGFVFQSYQLIPTLTALENVLLPYELNAEAGGRRAGLERARQLLDVGGAGERLDHYPVQLSGGEQQRVALARAFMLRPPIVLADEPTGNLDSTNGQHVLDLLLELNRAEGTTLVLVTHDPALAAHASRRIILRDGAIVAEERYTAKPCSGRSDDGVALVLDCRPHRDARTAQFAGEVCVCSAVRCGWRGCADGSARILGVVSLDASAAGAQHHGGGSSPRV